MKPLVVLNVVGLTSRQLGEATPHLVALRDRGVGAPMGTVLPAVTMTVQATLLTGEDPAVHGAVGNGWYFPVQGEVLFWRQSSGAVEAPKVYERARAELPGFTCAKLFWWWNMGAAVDWSVTPRPFYPADGRKILAVYGKPDEYPASLEKDLGKFPFFDFWGPKAGLGSSRWIASATVRTLEERRPSLTLAYLPHLDYDQQRYGPEHERSVQALRDVDALVGEVVQAADRVGADVFVVSEYGIEAVDRPVHPNRALRRAGLLEVRRTPVGEVLDTYASRAFCVCDHQVAHVYAADEEAARRAHEVLEPLEGVAQVLDADGIRVSGLAHRRTGRRVLVAKPGAWFAYPYWLDDDRAPDFARTVDIHRKPGYDPCELFLDPELKLPALRIARRLAQKAMGMRYLMDVVPLDASLVKGSHGRLPDDVRDGPVFLSTAGWDECGGEPDEGLVDPRSFPDRVLAALRRG